MTYGQWWLALLIGYVLVGFACMGAMITALTHDWVTGIIKRIKKC